MLKIKNPDLAKEYENYLFNDTEEDKQMELTHDPSSIIKFYPGSSEGPLPEDNPKHYSEWFIRNQPVEALYGKDAQPDFSDIGAKWKFITNKRVEQDADRMTLEYKDEVEEYLNADEAHAMQHYEGVPEFAVADSSLYDEGKGKLPYLRFHTTIREDELLPLPENYTLDYSEVQWELERWTLFQALPNLMSIDRTARLLLQQMSTGVVKVPDYVNEVNPPTLWTYYETLPSWARENPIVRNVMMAMEYHHKALDIRQKETALNFACQFLRPVEETFGKVIVDMHMSQKLQLNSERGQKMLTELQFYELDIERLGSESEDYEDEEEKDVLTLAR